MSADDLSKYREMFVQEAREHVQNMNSALLALEKDHTSKEHLDSAFRAAHTIKGMAATMGYEQIRQVCKTIEELFDKLRKREKELSPNMADFLFSLFDMIENMVNDEKYGIDERIMGQLRAFIDAGSEAPPQVSSLSAKPEQDVAIEPKVHPQPTVQSQSPQTEASDIETQHHQLQAKTQTIRVNMDDLDSLVDLVGEIMISRMRLVQVLPDITGDDLRQVLRTLERLVIALQGQTMKIRLVPIELVFDRFPRMVRDLATSQEKEVKLEMEGTGIELDRTVLDAISDPLLHMLRNAVDHALEQPSEREAAGKPRQGTILLKASRNGDKVSIEVSDDGRGIDLDRVKAKALDKKLITAQEAEKMTEDEVIGLLGHPGLSTASKVTDISGRGVGLNVVISKVESVGGTCKIKTKKGQGTTFVLTIPLSLAIIRGLLVSVGREKYIVPISSVLATIQIDPSEVKSVHNKPVMMFRGQVVSLVRASTLLGVSDKLGKTRSSEMLTVVVMDKGGKPLGLIVDSFESKQDVVLKHIDKIGYPQSSTVPSDATILPDGKVALILDPVQIVEA
jgi:two-component system chemotaxis sensor kinase CheA